MVRSHDIAWPRIPEDSLPAAENHDELQHSAQLLIYTIPEQTNRVVDYPIGTPGYGPGSGHCLPLLEWIRVMPGSSLHPSATPRMPHAATD